MPTTRVPKPTPASLAIDLSGLTWRRSGDGPGAIEVAMTRPDPAAGRPRLVLMRVRGDPSGRVLVYDQHEWECFLAGVRSGEFDLLA